ncbi:MAG: helix-turn-helix domain-containing protein [Bauldia sp.]
MTDGDEIMDVSGLARYLRVSPSNIYKMASAGLIPGFKVGKHWRFRRSDIDGWSQAGAVLEPRPPASGTRGITTRSLAAPVSPAAARKASSGFEGALSERQIAMLRDRWIETPEQLIAMVAQPLGLAKVAEMLGLARENVSEIARSLEARSRRPGGTSR